MVQDIILKADRRSACQKYPVKESMLFTENIKIIYFRSIITVLHLLWIRSVEIARH
jgi:hypothetical protein